MLDLTAQDTIVAPVTPPGAGGVAIVRLSGDRSREIVGALLDVDGNARWLTQDARLLNLYTLLAPADGSPIDQALLVWFEEGKSFTGEEVAEIQCHGSPLIVDQLIRECEPLGARLAEPGEFSFRAFRSGRLDLTAAEGLLALTHAQTKAGESAALRTLEGGLRKAIDGLRTRLVDLMAKLEVTFDYPEDVEDGYDHLAIAEALVELQMEVQALLESWKEQQVWADGLRVVLVGAPNAGKSSLMNALLGDQRVLVHETPGTTRDVIEATLLVEGYRIRLFDTAGRRETEERIEAAGLELAERYLADAHLCLHLVDRSQAPTPADVALSGSPQPRLILLNKSDLPMHPETQTWVYTQRAPSLNLSALTGDGLSRLRATLADFVSIMGGGGEAALFMTQRQFKLLSTVATELAAAIDLAVSAQPEDLVVLHLREALTALLCITGEVYDVAVLEAIFSQFCVGK